MVYYYYHNISLYLGSKLVYNYPNTNTSLRHLNNKSVGQTAVKSTIPRRPHNLGAQQHAQSCCTEDQYRIETSLRSRKAIFLTMADLVAHCVLLENVSRSIYQRYIWLRPTLPGSQCTLGGF
jgi:hypothetical protein